MLRILPALSAVLTLFSGCDHGAPQRREPTIQWMLPLDIKRPLFESIATAFQAAHPDIRLELLWVPSGQYDIKFKTLAAAGQIPDVFYCGDVWIAYMQPFLKDLTPYLERDASELDLDDFFPALLEATRYDGRSFFLPYSFNISLLYYNRDLFDAAGVEYPQASWTWEDFLAAARKLTRTLEDGTQIWGSDIKLGWWGEWLIYVRQAGGLLFSEDLTRCLLDEETARRGIQFYYDKIYRYRISPSPGYRPAKGFSGGTMAMSWGEHTGDWPVFDATLGSKWDVTLLPAGPVSRRGGELAVDAFGISRNCAHPEAAWELLKFLASKETIARLAAAGSVPVRKSVAESHYGNPGRRGGPANWTAAYEALQYSLRIPQSPYFIELALQIIQPEIDLMASGKQSPEVACRRAAEAANAFVETLGARTPQP